MSKSTHHYPQGNRQEEASYKTIISNLKKRHGKKGMTANELPAALLAHRTGPCQGTGESLFSLVFRMEAVILAEIEVPSFEERISMAKRINKRLNAQERAGFNLRKARTIFDSNLEVPMSSSLYYNPQVKKKDDYLLKNYS